LQIAALLNAAVRIQSQEVVLIFSLISQISL